MDYDRVFRSVFSKFWLLTLYRVALISANFRTRPAVLYADRYLLQYFTSPNYPRNYPNNANYSWLIKADIGYLVHLTLVEIDLQTGVDCLHDSVRVYEDHTPVSPPLRTFCTRHISDVYSTGNRMYVTFTSDGSGTRRGFKFAYKAVSPLQVSGNPCRQTPCLNGGTCRSYDRISTTCNCADGYTGHNCGTRSSTVNRQIITTQPYSWSSRVDTGSIVGGVVGGVFLLLVLCVVFIHYSKCRVSSRASSTTNEGGNGIFTLGPTRDGTQRGASWSSATHTGPNNPPFSPFASDPPPYSSVQNSCPATVQHSLLDEPPPDYTEVFLRSHPPGTFKVA